MDKNIGRIDRAARLLVGIGLLALAFSGRTWWGLLGLPALVSAFWGTCPLYTMTGFATRREPSNTDGRLLGL